MKIKAGYTLRKRDGQNVIISEKGELNNAITLSETAAFLWQQLSECDLTKEQLLNALLAKYDISTVLALNDIDIFLRILSENEILE